MFGTYHEPDTTVELAPEGIPMLATLLATLTPRDQKVLMLRFGLEDGRSRTLREVGEELGVSRGRIHQIEANALRRLRHPSRRRPLKEFLR